MKLLIVSGTPKTDGLTFSFVERARETAKELGVDAEVVRLAGMKLSKCMMCNDGWGTCADEHRCAFGDKDGFNDLQERLKDIDAFIYISPVYWGEVSEDMKVYFDRLRRCQASKSWDEKAGESFLNDKPSILVAVAGGGGGGIISAFEDMERAISHMGGDGYPRENVGIMDYIAVNRWNKDYKREAFRESIKTMVNSLKTANSLIYN